MDDIESKIAIGRFKFFFLFIVYPKALEILNEPDIADGYGYGYGYQGVDNKAYASPRRPITVTKIKQL